MASKHYDHTYLDRVGNLIWADIEGACRFLAYSMGYNRYKPEIIVGITRGGIIPAVILSHLIGVPRVETLPLQLRDGNQERELYGSHTWHTRSDFFNRQEVLFVDDLWDSGKTMRTIGEYWPNALRATMYHKSEASARGEGLPPPINFPGLWIPHDKWVVFPWEQKTKVNGT